LMAFPNVESFRANCEKGDMMECYFYGRRLLNQGKTKEARLPLQKAFESGDMKACEYLGEIVEKEGNLVEAEKYLLHSCNYRPKNCDQLAGIYIKLGKYATAKDFYQKACNANNLYGCASWALVDAKEKKYSGEERLKESCHQNNKTGCFLISELYLNRKTGVLKSYLPYFKKSCQFGHKEACEALK